MLSASSTSWWLEAKPYLLQHCYGSGIRESEKESVEVTENLGVEGREIFQQVQMWREYISWRGTA